MCSQYCVRDQDFKIFFSFPPLKKGQKKPTSKLYKIFVIGLIPGGCWVNVGYISRIPGKCGLDQGAIPAESRQPRLDPHRHPRFVPVICSDQCEIDSICVCLLKQTEYVQRCHAPRFNLAILVIVLQPFRNRACWRLNIKFICFCDTCGDTVNDKCCHCQRELLLWVLFLRGISHYLTG